MFLDGPQDLFYFQLLFRFILEPMSKSLVAGGWPGCGWWREMWVWLSVKVFGGTAKTFLSEDGGRQKLMLSTPSFFPSASSMLLNMLPAMPLTMRLSPWKGFGPLIPIPLQPKAASSRLPWLCLRIWERRECLGYWVWGTPFMVLISARVCPRPLLPVCFVFPWPSRVFSAPGSVSSSLFFTWSPCFSQSLSPVNVQLYSTLCPLSTVLFSLQLFQWKRP